MSIKYPVLLFALLLLCFSGHLQAQGNSFIKLRVEDGLSSNYIKSVHIDELGYVWLATLEGLDRFDGVEIRPFSSLSPYEEVEIHCFTNDPVTGIWLGAEDHLFYWDFIRDGFETIQLGDDVSNIRCLQSCKADTSIYVGTSNGIIRIDADTREIQQVIADVNITNSYFCDNLNKLYFTSLNKGLVTYDVRTKTIQYYQTDQVDRGLVAISRWGQNLVVATDTKELLLFDTKTKEFNKLPLMVSDYILTLTFDPINNLLCIGTDGGGLILYNMEDNSSRLISHDSSNPSSLSSNSIYSVQVDSDGRYWIGTYSAGLNYSKRINGVIKVKENLDELNIGQQSIRSLLFNQNLKMIGTRDGFFVSNPDKGIYKFYRKEETERLRSNIILCFHPLNDSQILIGTYGGGVSLYDAELDMVLNYRSEDDFISGAIYDVVDDINDNQWFLSLNGLYKINPTGEVQVFNEENSDIADNQLYAGYMDSNHRLWLGSMTGTTIYDISKGIPIRINTAVELPKDKTVSFFEDSKNTMWVATEKGGLYQVTANLGKIQLFNQEDGLVNNSVSSITEYPEGFLWLTTLKGLSRFDVEHKLFQSYTLSDGLPGLAFNPNAMVNNIAGEGELWLGNEKGLVHFHPDSLSNKQVGKNVQITDVFVNGSRFIVTNSDGEVQLTEKLSNVNLKSSQNNLGFRFVSLNYNPPSDNTYLYRLKGVEENWKSLKGDNQVIYQDLPSGNYVFEVCLANANNTADVNTLRQLNINIKPPFYQDPIGLGLIITFVLLVTISIFYYQKEQRKKSEKNLQLKKHEGKKYESSRLTSDKSQEMLKTISTFIVDNESYLDADLKIADLAKKLDCSPNEISQAINQNLNITFNEFINGFRVKRVIEMMDKPEYSKYTLIALAQNCGFNSKTSFYRIFKKETGFTPAEYYKRLKSKE